MSIVMPLLTLVQIAVLSFYIPNLFYRFANTEISRYPESEYPLLYTLGTATRLARQRICKLLNAIAGALCFVGLVTGLVLQLDAVAWSNVLITCMLLQILPYVWSARWEIQVRRLRAKMPKPIIRKAELSPRRLADMVNPIALYLFFTVSAIVIGMTAYFMNTDLIKINKGLTVLTANVCFTAFIAYKVFFFLRNPREDPYAASKDELKKAQLQARACIVAGSIIVLSSLFSLFKSLNWLSPSQEIIFVAVFFSIFAQGALLRSAQLKLKKLESSDYGVFRRQLQELATGNSVST